MSSYNELNSAALNVLLDCFTYVCVGICIYLSTYVCTSFLGVEGREKGKGKRDVFLLSFLKDLLRSADFWGPTGLRLSSGVGARC